MWHFVIYTAKASLFLAMATILFRILLSRENQPRVNRIVLLVSVAMSFILPLLTPTRVINKEIDDVASYRTSISDKKNSLLAQQRKQLAQQRKQLEQEEHIASTEEQSQPLKINIWAFNGLITELFNFEKEAEDTIASYKNIPFRDKWKSIFTFLFCFGAILVLSNALLAVTRLLMRIRHGSKKRLTGGNVLIICDEDITPHCWFKYIFLSRNDQESMSSEDLRLVLSHERAHAILHHSLDILLIELATTLQWYNPAIWMLRRELSTVHEYEADKAVLDSGIDAHRYKYLLVNNTAIALGYSIACRLTTSSLRSRISMMSRPAGNKMSAAKGIYLIILIPLYIILTANSDYRVVLDKHAKIEGLDWSIASMTTEQFIDGYGRENKMGDVITIIGEDNKIREIQSTFLAGKNIAILTEDGHRVSCTNGGMVKVDTRKNGSISEANFIWRPQLSLDEHFYLAKKSLLEGKSRHLIEISRPSFEKELQKGTNRKVLLSVRIDQKKRNIIIFE